MIQDLKIKIETEAGKTT